LKFQAGTI